MKMIAWLIDKNFITILLLNGLDALNKSLLKNSLFSNMEGEFFTLMAVARQIDYKFNGFFVFLDGGAI